MSYWTKSRHRWDFGRTTGANQRFWPGFGCRWRRASGRHAAMVAALTSTPAAVRAFAISDGFASGCSAWYAHRVRGGRRGRSPQRRPSEQEVRHDSESWKPDSATYPKCFSLLFRAVWLGVSKLRVDQALANSPVSSANTTPSGAILSRLSISSGTGASATTQPDKY